jgi:hypothetical protein
MLQSELGLGRAWKIRARAPGWALYFGLWFYGPGILFSKIRLGLGLGLLLNMQKKVKPLGLAQTKGHTGLGFWFI